MSGRILIIDTVATNRIVLKVKMHAAQYGVDTCANRDEAEAAIATNKPDLILMNLSDHSEDRHAFCRDLKADPDTSDIAIIALGVADTCRARFAALDAGADEVIPRPTDDTLLLARIRSLLRMRHAYAELWLRDGTSRALGFEDKKTAFIYPAQMAVLMPDLRLTQLMQDKLHKAFPGGFRQMATDHAFENGSEAAKTDLFIIDGTTIEDRGARLFRLIADLRARAEARLSMQLVILPQGETEIAAMALDLGADDVVFEHAAAAEWALRAKVLLARKSAQDKLRTTVRDGLHAAVTDPLTGLYNRRYVTSYLQRMETQARKSGQSFAIMMMDVDHFKSVNDTHGHAAGDAVLCQIAQRLRDNLRHFDLIARVGGEEFLVAMPNSDVDRARTAADRIRHLINREPFDLGPGKPALRITMSIGVAVGGTSPDDTASGTTLCGRADAALYAAKLGGRNKVSLAQAAA